MPHCVGSFKKAGSLHAGSIPGSERVSSTYYVPGTVNNTDHNPALMERVFYWKATENTPHERKGCRVLEGDNAMEKMSRRGEWGVGAGCLRQEVREDLMEKGTAEPRLEGDEGARPRLAEGGVPGRGNGLGKVMRWRRARQVQERTRASEWPAVRERREGRQEQR